MQNKQRICQLIRSNAKLIFFLICLFLIHPTHQELVFKFYKNGFPLQNYDLSLIDNKGKMIQNLEYEKSLVKCKLDYKEIIYFQSKRIKNFEVNRHASNLKKILFTIKDLNINNFQVDLSEEKITPIFFTKFKVMFDIKQDAMLYEDQERNLLDIDLDTEKNYDDLSMLDSIGYPMQKLYFLDVHFRVIDIPFRLIIVDNARKIDRRILLI